MTAPRILVIDDDALMRRMLSMIAGGDGYVVETAASAVEAMKRVCNGEWFDAIFCDIRMPEMSGIEFFQSLLRDYPVQAKRVVLLSGDAFNPEFKVVTGELSLPIVAKPFKRADIISARDRLIAESSTQADMPI